LNFVRVFLNKLTSTTREFNRDVAQIKLALEVFIELGMIEFIEDKVYRVKNFAKHQNIKVKEKEISKNKEADIKNIDVPLNENSKVEIKDDEDRKLDDKTAENIVTVNGGSLETFNKDTIVVDDSLKDEKSRDNLQEDVPVILETKKSRKKSKKKTDQIIDITDEETNDDSICCFTDGVRPLGEGESTMLEFSFG